MRAFFALAPDRHPPRRLALALLLCLVLGLATPVAGAPPVGAANAGVITRWNQVAADVIPANPAAFLNYSFVHLAMYNAVVGITREYELYEWNARGPRVASPEAAAAVAAHRILMTYFGTTAGVPEILDAALAASLAEVPDGDRKEQGIEYGLRAADHIIALRAGDGRGAVVQVPTADEPGEWRPTPPANAAFAVPWLGQVKPLGLNSLTQLDPGPPPAIGSELYLEELAEVRAYGAIDSTLRTPAQTTTARYFADVPFKPMEAALGDVATRYALDISDSARLFAVTNVSMADALGSVWNAKLKYLWWRPITAIREDDGDPATTTDPDWTPLIITPPYPEWPSGLCTVISAMTASLDGLMGGVDLRLVSPSQGLRHFTSKADLDQQAVDARVWSGIHFRTSDEVAIDIGTEAADWTLAHYFAPSR